MNLGIAALGNVEGGVRAQSNSRMHSQKGYKMVKFISDCRETAGTREEAPA